MKPFVSICIPVFKTEQFLEEALQSVASQTFKQIEIILVNDASSQTNENGLSCKEIVTQFKKKNKIKITYIEHSKNKGLVEARRTALYEAKGEYVFFFDSDDLLTPNAIQDLVYFAQTEKSDIVQGGFELFPNVNTRQIPNYFGALQGNQIFRSWIIEKKTSSFLWAKLIKKEILLEAFNLIPPVFCNMGEDFLIWFFVTRFANSYFGIENIVYKYRQTSGMTSNKIIDNQDGIKMIASTASVFTIIFSWANEQKALGKDLFQQDEIQALYDYSYIFLENNLNQIQRYVVPELQECAYEIMCDFWGKSFVDKVKSLK